MMLSRLYLTDWVPGVWCTSCISILSFTLLITGYFIYNIYLHPLSIHPGPKWRVASPIPYIIGLVTGRHHIIVKELHQQYGSVVRTAPNKLSFITAPAWRDIYGHKKANELEMPKDPQWYLPDPNAQHIILSDRERHAHFRRLFSNGFSDRSLRDQEPLLQHYVSLFLDGLEGLDTVDIVQRFNWTTFDIIGDLTFGEPFGCLEHSMLHPWVRDMFEAIRGTVYLRVTQEFPGLRQYVNTILPRILPMSSIKRRQENLQYTREKVMRRLNNKDNRPDFMDNVLRQPEGKGLTLPEMFSNSFIFILAGSETTATLLSGAVYLLLRHPEIKQKLVYELDAAFPDETAITTEATSRLTYLAAVIQEALRLYPPVPIGLPRVVPEGGAIVNGQFIPAGTSVTVSHLAAYTAPKNFQDPEVFIPERFIHREAYYGQHEVLQPFSHGPRNCIGKNLAYAELRLILARLFHRFEMRLGEESNGWMDQRTYLMWEKPPLHVHLKDRRPQ
ncbi:cytochrome P450 [Aspergillus aurantiobrunneus]